MEMRKYETVMVYESNLGEAQVKEENNRYQKLLETNGAKEIAFSIWGKKELANPHRKPEYGTYVSINFKAPSDGTVAALTNLMRLTDNVMKFQSHLIRQRVRKVKVNPKRKVGVNTDDSMGFDIDY